MIKSLLAGLSGSKSKDSSQQLNDDREMQLSRIEEKRKALDEECARWSSSETPPSGGNTASGPLP